MHGIEGFMRGFPSYVLLVLLTVPLFQQFYPLIRTEPLKGAYQKKPLATLSLQAWWSGEFQNGYDGWHRENVGFRSSLVRLHNQKDYELYGKVNADKIVVGKDGYLFEEPYLIAWSGADVLGDERIREIAAKLLDIQKRLKAKGKTFIVAMAPGKASFFPEFVPARYAAARQPRNNGEAIAPILREVGVNLLDYNQKYIDQRKTSDSPLFGKTGIHWSNYGAVNSLRDFISLVEKDRGTDLPNVSLRSTTMSLELRDPDGDLGGLMNLMIPIEHYPMALLDWEWEKPEGRERLKLTAFADSFFQQFVQFGITPGCFREVDYYFYDSLVWNSTTSPPHGIVWTPATKEAAMKSVDDSEVVLILATEMNYSGLGFGYLDALRSHLE
jgi:hypothetical protein